jgi:hypothetical protein
LFTGQAIDTPQCVIYACIDHDYRVLSAEEQGIQYYHNTCSFTSPGGEGTVDIAAGTVWLHLSPLQPMVDIDYCLRIVYALLAFRGGGLLFHAAGIVRDEQAFVFFGHSGSGKTTVARHSPAGSVLNDDLVLLMPEGEGWQVHATPFWNPSQVRPSGPQCAPLAMMLRLVQSRQVFLEDMKPGQALAEVISCVPIVATDAARSHEVLKRSLHMLHTVPIYRLHFLPDASFWQAIDTMEK